MVPWQGDSSLFDQAFLHQPLLCHVVGFLFVHVDFGVQFGHFLLVDFARKLVQHVSDLGWVFSASLRTTGTA